MMAYFNLLACLHFPHGGNKKGMSLCSGLAGPSCDWVELWRNLPIIKNPSKVSGSMNVMVGYLCV